MQLVVMSLKVGEVIPEELHDDIDQFIRVEKGSAYVKIDDAEFNLSDDDVVIVPAFGTTLEIEQKIKKLFNWKSICLSLYSKFG